MRRFLMALAALATLSLTNCGYNVIQSQVDLLPKTGASHLIRPSAKPPLRTTLVWGAG